MFKHFQIFYISALLFGCFLFLPHSPSEAGLSGYESSEEIAGYNFKYLSELHAPKEVQLFYDRRRGVRYWTNRRSLKTNGKLLLKALDDSWTHGLNPRRYHLERIHSFVGQVDADKYNDLEVLLTDAFIMYAQDLSGMRVDPKGLKIDPDSWLHPYGPDYILSALDSGRSFDSILQSYQSRGKTYGLLRQELIRLNREEEQESLIPIVFEQVIRPGHRHDTIPAIRERLGVKRRMPDQYLYDDYLSNAVMQFQNQQNLSPDGIIGQHTVQALNRTRELKMLQIIANLERLRWVPDRKPDRFITVNIPSATLWAVEKGEVALEMPVVVGTPVRPTLSFISTIKGVRLNPDWTVPVTVKIYDIWPKVKNDPLYLQNKGIELIEGYGAMARTLDPSAIDWTSIKRSELLDIRMVQTPGVHNPLGRVRVLMPNKYNIYLHDTNNPEYFERAQRALSSGCIRMKYPVEVANFILGKDLHQNISGALETGEKTDLQITDTLPVYIVYYTVWVDAEGKVVYGADVYNEDERLIQKLKDLDGFYIPGHSSNTI